ncbi:hypothetical protein OZZ08_12955 [Malaciobacter mytili]|uniref:hypothetical protein n=1 Tax=Malaciobacter mytili TaxID=603050 RepID=UPI003BB0EF9D
MHNNQRRMFLKKTSILALSIFSFPNILEAKNTIVDDLTSFCFTLFPHKGLSLKYYEKCSLALLNSEDKKLIKEGVLKLNKIYNTSFSKLDYQQQKKVLIYISSIDKSFFVKVKSYLVTGLYNNKQTWNYFGYEGASFSKGGYFYRGFDDISWIKG